MNVDLFLVAPADAPDNFVDQLAQMLEQSPVAALFLPRGTRGDADYESFVRAVLPVAQSHDTAVLVDNDPDLCIRLNADGAHMTGGAREFAEAAKRLHPDMIVGAGDIHSRHDAMTKGENGADYIMFGSVDAPADRETIENALWWAETFEVPTVLASGGGWNENMAGCEFAGIGGDTIWKASQGALGALAVIAVRCMENA